MGKLARDLTLIAVLTLSAVSSSNARAAYVVTFQQVGPNVLEKGSGTLDLTDLSLVHLNVQKDPFIYPGFGIFQSGAPGDALEEFSGSLTGPANFGFGMDSTPNLSSGNGVAFDRTGELIFVPDGYIFGTLLSETSTFQSTSLFSLGIPIGAYTYGWGSGDHADTFTIRIVDGGVSGSVPETSTWVMMMIGFAGLGYAALRRKAAPRPLST